MNLLPAFGLISLLIWCVLVFARGGFWRVRFPGISPAPSRWPEVVAIVPARDEVDVIEKALTSLLQQDYRGPFRIILVDDHSADGTAHAARLTATALGLESRLEIVAARELPPGWTGKVWAQAEGYAVVEARASETRYVWLTDADIWHAPDTLSRLVARATAEQLVLTSLMVRLRCASVSERALIPAFVFFFAKLYPFTWVRDPRSRSAAAAGGCMLAAYDALQQIGGMAAIKGALIDDCALARALKEKGPIRLDFADGSISLRSYADWRSIWNMIARSAFTQLHYSPLLLAGTLLGMCLTYLAPPILAFCGEPGAWSAGLAWLFMMFSYGPMLRYYGRSPLWAPLLPLVALFYLGATCESARRYWSGQGGQWKGRNQASAHPSREAPGEHRD